MPFTPTTELVTRGPYRYIRNPILLGVSLFYFGATSLPFGWLVGLTVFGGSLLLGGIYYRAVEERQLEERFGEAYRTYKRQTPFLVPRIPLGR